jgi:hypothetical protein
MWGMGKSRRSVHFEGSSNLQTDSSVETTTTPRSLPGLKFASQLDRGRQSYYSDFRVHESRFEPFDNNPPISTTHR